MNNDAQPSEKFFRVAFVTMVWRDYWLLERWIAHNARLVPLRHLHVINHGGDPEVDRIAAGCNIIHLPRDEVTIDLTERRWALLSAQTNGLLAFYDRVICTDVDEFLVYLGDKRDLLAHLAAKPVAGDALAPMGLNLIPVPAQGVPGEAPLLARWPHALVNAKYTKPCIAARRVQYTTGGHGLRRGRFEIDPEVAMLHLHYVTPDYAERMAARAQIVAESRAANAASATPRDMPARYWINWSNSDMIREKELSLFAGARLLDPATAFAEAAAALQDAMRSKDRKTVIEPAAMPKPALRLDWPPSLIGAI
jgi:hypothetical protein